MNWLLWLIIIIGGLLVAFFIGKVIYNITSGNSSGEGVGSTIWDACCKTLGIQR